jgi:iron complex transport system permease protein
MDDEKFERMKAEYNSHVIRKIGFIILCIAFMVVMIAVSVNIGGYDLSFIEVYNTIINHIIGVVPEEYSKEWYDYQIVWNNRLPRILFAILSGVGLAVSGATMQSVMKNPLAEPYTTGVSAGACFGVAISMVIGVSILPSLNMGLEAFILALIPVCIIIIMSPKLNNSVATIILIGTALTYMFNAFSTLLLVTTDSETLAAIYKWQVGSFTNISWDRLTTIAIFVIIGTIVIEFLSHKLNIMTLGDNAAQSLGINVRRIRILCLLVMALMVACIVSYAGIIGFVGLICPHIIRLIIGSDNRFLIPAASAFGAAFLLFADSCAKWLSSLDMVPVGAICGLIGAPLFLFILMRNRREIW